MPRSAISAGLVDRVLAPDLMPEFLAQHIARGYQTDVPPRVADEGKDATSLDPVLAVLRSKTIKSPVTLS